MSKKFVLDNDPFNEKRVRTFYVCKVRADISTLKYPILTHFLHLNRIYYERVPSTDKKPAHIKVYTKYELGNPESKTNKFFSLSPPDFKEIFTTINAHIK